MHSTGSRRTRLAVLQLPLVCVSLYLCFGLTQKPLVLLLAAHPAVFAVRVPAAAAACLCVRVCCPCSAQYLSLSLEQLCTMFELPEKRVYRWAGGACGGANLIHCPSSSS